MHTPLYTSCDDLATGSLRRNERVRVVSADAQGIVVAIETAVLSVSWTGHIRAAYDPFAVAPPPPLPPSERAHSSHRTSAEASESAAKPVPIASIVHHPACDSAVVILRDGTAALCLSDANEASALSSLQATRWLLPSSGGASCGAISAQAHMLALGCADGVLRLWTLGGGTSGEEGPTRELSLTDWGYGPAETGGVACVAWTPDGEVPHTFLCCHGCARECVGVKLG